MTNPISRAAAITLVVVLTGPFSFATDNDPRTPPRVIQIRSAVVTLIEEVDVPAQETGILAEMNVREGQLIQQGELLGKIDDTRARLNYERAKIEFENATKQADNDLGIRSAEKSLEVAKAELRRATLSLERYPKSISATEIDRLQLSAEEAALAVEQARFEHELAQFVRRLRQAELELAAHDLERRQITAPISGMLVEVKRRQGEWVEPSESVIRIVRMDRLRAEGFLDSQEATGNLAGCRVELSTVLPGGEAAQFQGELVFVSPEISPINNQMRIWAEIDNPDLLLRPGLRGTMVLEIPGDGASD
jgi:macrolide-specific efflux system membrane fusion protein